MAGMAAMGAAIIGDYMSAQGQQSANAQSLANIQQEETWMTNMSDTAMQRRVADLNAAGLNPLLAVGQGGASTPGIGPAQIGNPNMAFGQLGGQASSAISAQQQQAVTNQSVATSNSQRRMYDSQAAWYDADAANRPGMDRLNQANADAAIASMNVSNATVTNLGEQLNLTKAQIDNLVAQNPGLRADSQVSQLDAETKYRVMESAIRASIATNGYNAWRADTPAGRMITAFGPSVPAGAVQTAASAVDVAKGKPVGPVGTTQNPGSADGSTLSGAWGKVKNWWNAHPFPQ